MQLPGYVKVDAMAGYQFGPALNQERFFQLSVNVENLTNRTNFQMGKTPTVIFPGAPINAVSRLEVRF